MSVRHALRLTVMSLLAGCGGGNDAGSAAPASSPWFESVAATRGLRFEHDSGRGDGYLMPEIMCGGAALVDVDDDGDLDAYIVQAGGITTPPGDRPPNRLFINDGSGRFTDVTDDAGDAGDRGYGMGVACGDYDGDGLTDLYVTNVGANTLLRNLGGVRFEDVTATAGVGDDGWGSSAAFVDYDADGDLDLFVCNYLAWSTATEKTCWSPIDGAADYCSPQSYDTPVPDVLYRNDGDGAFTDVSVSAGIGAATGTGLGVVCGDFDGNDTVDIFVANDGMADRLWSGRGDGTFADVAVEAGCAYDQEGRASAGMGVAAADVDADGDLDLLVCNLRNEPDTLLRNEGGWFANVTAVAGLGSVSRRFTRFGTALLDFDNDGAVDLYQANGRVSRHPEPWSEVDAYAEPNLLWRGGASGRFTEVTPRGGTTDTLIATSRAAAFGDVDGDGGLDVLVVNMDGPAHLLRNTVPRRGHWLTVSARERGGQPALGATVTLEIGDRRVVGVSRAAYSYQSSSDPRVHFGLGDSTRVDRVTVTWVDGSESVLDDVAVDRIVEMRREP